MKQWLVVLVVLVGPGAWCLVPGVAYAQETLQLGELVDAALASDPRTAQVELLERASALRQRNVSAQWRPAVGLEAQAQAQSDAVEASFRGPDGRPVFSASRQTYDSYLRVEQRLFDRGIGIQGDLERTQLAEQQARVRAAVYAVRQQVNEAFFAALTLEQRARVLQAALAELEARLREAQARVEQGTALAADAAAVEATLLERRQAEDEVQSNRRAALARLAAITGRQIPREATLAVPDLAARAAHVTTGSSQQLRPEYQLFASTRMRLAVQQALAGAQGQPRVSAFMRAGVGRPGLNFAEHDTQAYALGGVRLQWNAWNWGTPQREREALALQQQITAADQDYFSRQLAEGAAVDTEAIARLQRAVEGDARIVALREQVERTAGARMQEGVLTASDYLARNAELLQARVAQATHRIELEEARARLLTRAGVEVR
ncbi:MAG: TolC family protein [Vicinamibacterales bacterium]